MKFLVLLFSDLNEFQNQKIFPSAAGGLKSAFDRSMEWAAALDYDGAQKKISVIEGKGWTSGQLLESVAAAAKKEAADFVVLARTSCAFLDLPLSKKLIQDHVEFRAEYTFADGYPFGFAPEIIDAGAASIMAELCKSVGAEEAKKGVSKDSVFNVIKGDVNSFEIETEISSVDMRLLRLNFSCDTKLNCLCAKNVALALAQKGRQDLLELDKESVGEKNVLEICAVAKNLPGALKTLPSFYNIQIEGRCFSKNFFSPYEPRERRMDYESFKALAGKIKAFSDKAVVSLSLFGEAAMHPDFDKFALCVLQAGLGLFVEVDGGFLPDFLLGQAYKNLSASLTEEQKKSVFVAASLDSFSQEKFSIFHSGDLQKSVQAVKDLAADFTETYPQFTRVVENEDELEAFYRFWSDKNSPSNGKIIVQKYDNFCGLLLDKKTADLAPLVREPCWHLRRDMDILLDGSVPFCRDRFLEAPLGNAFEQGLEEIWQMKDSLLAEQTKGECSGACGKCDEYYTFNF